MNRRHVVALLSFVAPASMLISGPALADLSQSITYKWTANPQRFDKRLTHLREQIDLAQSKGWLTSDQVARFKADHERVAGLERAWAGKSYPESESEPLERETTSLHHFIHSAIATGSQPAMPADVTITTTTSTKTAPKAVTKTTTKTKTKIKTKTKAKAKAKQ